MPHITVNNAKLYYEDTDPSNKQKPVLVFAHGLLWSTQLFEAQVAYFKKRYRCIAFDFRGQGQSEVTKSGYDMDTLTDDAIALIEALGVQKCHFVGLSMGGFVGQRLAINRPDLLSSLILLETSADAEEESNLPKYQKLMSAIKWLGIKRVSKKIMPILFGQSFLNDKNRKADYKLWLQRLNQNNKQGAVKATLGVIKRQAIYPQLCQIQTPTLIVVGDEDAATPYAKAERIHFAVAGSKLAVIKGAGHTSTVESADLVNKVMDKFLQDVAFTA